MTVNLDRRYAAIRHPIKKGVPDVPWQLNPKLISTGESHHKPQDKLIIFRDQRGWWVYGSISPALYQRYEASVSDFLDLLWRHQQTPWKAISGVYTLSFSEDGLVTGIRPAMRLFPYD